MPLFLNYFKNFCRFRILLLAYEILCYNNIGVIMKLKEFIEKSNQNADYTENYEKNKQAKKKLFTIGCVLASCGLVVSLTCFILWAIFGSNLKSIIQNTILLILALVFLVIFSVVFCIGIYFLKQSSLLHTEKQEEPTSESSETTQIIEIDNKK